MAGMIQSKEPNTMRILQGLKFKLGDRLWSKHYGPKIDALQQSATEQPQQGTGEASTSEGDSEQQQSENGSSMLTGSENAALGGGRMKKKTLLGG